MAKKKKNPQLIFIESDESPKTIRAKLQDKKLATFDLWVRKPDNEPLEPFGRRPRPRPRLCGCRRVCLAVIEDEF